MSRRRGLRIAFTPYTTVPAPIPTDFVPGGTLVFMSKEGLVRGAACSPIFEAAWNQLKDCSADQRWLSILEPEQSVSP